MSLRRLRHEERGAVVMIMAIVLVAVMGMLVLVVDLGRGVAYKRQVVTGTDAAALAAAQQCALGNGTVAATSAASDVLVENLDLSASITSIEMPECDAPEGPGVKTVTLRTAADMNYFFAPIFGFSSGSIAGEAVAVWGPSVSANPVPISVDLQQLLDCGIVPNDPPDEEIECDLVYPKDSLQEPRWGVLDFTNWNDPTAAPCTVSASDLVDMIENGGWPGDVTLNGDPPGSEPTYTCVDNGLSFSVWSAMEGRTLIFPVIDIATSLGHVIPPSSNGPPCTGADIPTLRASGRDCRIDTVNVISWMELIVVDADQKGATVTVQSTTSLTTSGGIPGGAFDLGVRGIRIVH